MTRYAEIADFGLAGASDEIVALASVSEANRYLDIASSSADSYLGRRINVPLTVWGDDLRQAVCRIAAYDLVSLNVGMTAGIDPLTTLWKVNRDLAVEWLEGVAEGKITPAWIASGVQGKSTASRIAPSVLTKTTRGMPWEL